MPPHKIIREFIDHGERGWITVTWEIPLRGKVKAFTGESTVSVDAARQRAMEKFNRWLLANRVTREPREHDIHHHDRLAVEEYERDRHENQ